MRHREWDLWIQKGFFGLISFCAVFLVNEIRGLSKSVEELNTKITVLVSQVSHQDEINKDFEARIRNMELRGRK